MRIKYLVLLSCVALPLTALSAIDSDQPPIEKAYPIEVSIQVAEEGSYKYVQTGTSAPLYVYEKDSPGKSNCTGGCAHAWPPLAVGKDASPLGDWTVLQRDDGPKQWVYKGQPVYLRFHDSASDPQGYKPSEGWYFLEP